MNPIKNTERSIIKLCWLFIILGMLEIFVFIFLSHSFFFIIPGLVTVIAAYLSMNKMGKKRRYFVGIWALIKYNPIGLAIIAFIMGDFFATSNIPENNYLYPAISLIIILGLMSFVTGIVIIVKISKHNKMIKLNDKKAALKKI